MANDNIKVKERGRRPPRIIIPQGEEGPKSDFDKILRSHKLRSKEGCILPVIVSRTMNIKSPDLDLTYKHEELYNSIDYTIGEN